MLSSFFGVNVLRVLISSVVLFFGSAKPCTEHSAICSEMFDVAIAAKCKPFKMKKVLAEK
jgi:hypothetical protein